MLLYTIYNMIVCILHIKCLFLILIHDIIYITLFIKLILYIIHDALCFEFYHISSCHIVLCYITIYHIIYYYIIIA